MGKKGKVEREREMMREGEKERKRKVK
jgi:hypothetical protein